MNIKARITANWHGRGYSPLETVNAQQYSIDTALDTDTDSWTFEFGDLDGRFLDMLDRNSEVRVEIFGVTAQRTKALNMGFADQIILRETGIFQVSGRDFTAAAVDSQHPPQIWKQIRPHSLVTTEARKLQIGGNLQLDKVPGFKSYSTDGSESWWQVWYRFYRKRRRWLYATPDGILVASTLNYNEAPSYYFGVPQGSNYTRTGQTWIPVQQMEWRADKTQRIGEVFIFGHNHHGKVGFVAHEKDDTVRRWIKRPTRIVSSQDVHNAAEARAEALEEIFESKVGAVEITLTVKSDIPIEQNKMAVVNLPSTGLTYRPNNPHGEWFVVGVTTVGSTDEGTYQVVRLREKFFAITRRVPSGPRLQPGPGGTSTQSDIAAGLDLSGGDQSYAQYFIDAAIKYHGPWPYNLFLGVLLSIGQHESGFQNKRESDQLIYPGSYPGVPSGQAPPPPTTPPLDGGPNFRKFREQFANSVSTPDAPFYGKRETGVGVMQLTTLGFKLLADRLTHEVNPRSPIDDELYGGRWNPQWNIMAGAAALASSLDAGVSISPQGYIRSVTPSGLSLQPTPENIWFGVEAYNAGRSGTAQGQKYAAAIRSIYTSQYQPEIEQATAAAAVTRKQEDAIISTKSGRALNNAVLNNSMISFQNASQKTDIQTGQIDPRVLRFLLAFTAAGFYVSIGALKSDHGYLTSEGRVSAHSAGRAVDLGHYDPSNCDEAMLWIRAHRDVLKWAQLIGPNESLVVNRDIDGGGYDRQTLNEHKNHIHVGWDAL